MVLVDYRLNSAMDRRTRFSSSISRPQRAKRLHAAIVHATRARKYAHTRWPTFLLWKTVVSIDNTVSTTIRVFQVPRGQTFMLAGSPVLAWNPVSVRTIIWPSNWAIRG